MKRQNGHSLIEMLVVLIIVGILIAIVVPAVQRARESARMAQCIHNQGQLANAIHMHLADEPYGRFPGYRAFASDGTTTIGWAPQVFEYLGRNDLDPTSATYIETLVCPSNQGPTDQPRLNYVVNGGQADIDSPSDGIFFDHAKAERVYITKDDFRDGLTNTILLSENLDATSWNATDEANQCILWPLVAGNEVNQGTGARPSSHHPGGFAAAFADGSVKFMNESEINDDAAVHTDGALYVAYLTPGGDDTPAVFGDDDDDDSDSGIDPLCGGLQARWTFNDPDDWYADEVGNYHGTPQSVAFQHDPSEKYGVLEFTNNDVDDFIQVGDHLDPGDGDYSVSVWCMLAPSSHGFGLVRKGGLGPGEWFLKSMNHNGPDHWRWVVTQPDSPGVTGGKANRQAHYPDPSLTTGNMWNHVVGVMDRQADEMRIYLNGTNAGQVPKNLTRMDAPELTIECSALLSIGAMGEGSVNSTFQGKMDDVRIYDCALTNDEVATLYNGGAGQPQDGDH